MVAIREHQHVKELAVRQEVEPSELKSFLFQVHIDLLLDHCVKVDQVLEDRQSVCDQQAVARFGSSVARPHYAAVLLSRVNEVFG